MTIHVRLALCLLLAAGLPAAAQTLGDAARKAEEARSRGGQTPAKVYTNADLPDAPPAPATGPSSSGSSSGVDGGKPTPAGRRDERAREADPPPPVPASEGRFESRKVGGLRGDAIETTLTLPFRAGAQNVPVTLVLRAVHEDRLPMIDTPVELEAKFLVDALFTGKVSFERPHVVLAIGEPPSQAVYVGSIDEHQVLTGAAITEVSTTIELDTLSRLEGASKIVGRLFSLEFTLSSGQVRLVGEFSRRARRNPGRGPAI